MKRGGKKKSVGCAIINVTFPPSVLTLLLLISSVVNVQCVGTLHEMSPRVVFTKQGPVQGFLGPPNTGIHHQILPGGQQNSRHPFYGGRPVVEIFRGIPYASPPIGPTLRYESPAPVPHRSRTEVFNANVSKPACPRGSEDLNTTSNPAENPFRALRKMLDSSIEDCLYLDVFAPLNSIYYNAGDKKNNNGLAVLVFMNSHVDDPENPFDGSSLAAIGNIIVVNVRYRAGVLGFLRPSYSDDVRANYGLWDQLAALQWIKENIGEFGGDFGNISLMGYDVDATVAGLLALSPVSQAYNGLFHRLILLNGSPLAPNAINPEPIRTTYHLTHALPSCPTDERNPGSLAKCLRSMPVSKLLTAAEKTTAPHLTYPFSPISDGIIVPHELSSPSPASTPVVQDMLKKYDILCGLKEGPVLPRQGRQALNIDLDRFINAVIKLTMKMESGSEPTLEVKKAVLRSLVHDQGYGTSPPMRELISDFLMVQPVIDLLNAHSRTEKKTFFYVFKEFDPLGVGKYDEVSYLFSSNVYRWKFTGTPSPSYKLHSFLVLIQLLANFVKNGDPNIDDPSDRFHPTQPWPQYTLEAGQYMEIASADDVQFRSGYRKHSTDFWGRTFHSIMQSFVNKTHLEGGSSTFPEFPPHFVPRQFDPNNFNVPPHHHPEEPPNETPDTILSGRTTVFIVGSIILTLQCLCCLGLFYQKVSLKKAEVRLRRRYLQVQDAMVANAAVVEDGRKEVTEDVEYSSSFVVNNHQERMNTLERNNRPPLQHQQNVRSDRSETETENGFGPDFLGPNYDPRTKVNRWMQMQQQRVISSENMSTSPSPNDPFNQYPRNKLMRLPHVNEAESPPAFYYNTPMPLMVQTGYPDQGFYQPVNPPQLFNHHHHVLSLNQVPPSLLLSTQQQQQQRQPLPPIPVVVNKQTSTVPVVVPGSKTSSLKRKSGSVGGGTLERKKVVTLADPEPHVQFIPQLPYQTPFKPNVGSGDIIPYADSRATSPSVISAPGGFTTRVHDKDDNNKGFIPYSKDDVTPTNSPKSILVSSNSNPPPKRSSTLIVRDLDPPDEESEPKYVAVKTGTLTRSVAVDTTDHDDSNSGATNNNNNNASKDNSRDSSTNSNSTVVDTTLRSPGVRVTFKESL